MTFVDHHCHKVKLISKLYISLPKTFDHKQIGSSWLFITIIDHGWSLDFHSQRMKSDEKEKLRSSNIKIRWDKHAWFDFIFLDFLLYFKYYVSPQIRLNLEWQEIIKVEFY